MKSFFRLGPCAGAMSLSTQQMHQVKTERQTDRRTDRQTDRQTGKVSQRAAEGSGLSCSGARGAQMTSAVLMHARVPAHLFRTLFSSPLDLLVIREVGRAALMLHHEPHDEKQHGSEQADEGGDNGGGVRGPGARLVVEFRLAAGSRQHVHRQLP